LKNHLLLIPDGIRRFSKKNHEVLSFTYEYSGRLLSDMVFELLNCNFIDELSVYPLASYNLNRSSHDTAALARGISKFLIKLSQSLQDNYTEIVHLGCIDTLNRLSALSASTLKNILHNKSSSEGKRLNLLLAYDSLNSCPVEIDVRNWMPFRNPIKLIYRFGQPKSLVRGSAIFPMSDQAFWSGTSTLFPGSKINTIIQRLKILFERIK